MPAPVDAGRPSFESIEALAKLLTAKHRMLLATIRDCKPGSVPELAKVMDKSEPHLLRTLEKLRDAGLVRMEPDGARQVPTAVISRIVVEIDPFSERPHTLGAVVTSANYGTSR